MIGRCCKGVMAWELESGLLHRFRAHHTVNSFFVDNENLSYNGILYLFFRIFGKKYFYYFITKIRSAGIRIKLYWFLNFNILQWNKNFYTYYSFYWITKLLNFSIIFIWKYVSLHLCFNLFFSHKSFGLCNISYSSTFQSCKKEFQSPYL